MHPSFLPLTPDQALGLFRVNLGLGIVLVLLASALWRLAAWQRRENHRTWGALVSLASVGVVLATAAITTTLVNLYPLL